MLDEKIIARAVTVALERVQQRTIEVVDQRATLERERTAITTAIRHLLDAVKTGRATETLLTELATQEERAKAIDRQLAAPARPVSRLLLQSVLGGQRVACTPFREPEGKGYRFRATGSYTAMLENMEHMDSNVAAITPTNGVAPTGFEPVFTVRHALAVLNHALRRR